LKPPCDTSVGWICTPPAPASAATIIGMSFAWVRLLPTKSTLIGCPATIGIGAIAGPAGGRLVLEGVPSGTDGALPPPPQVINSARKSQPTSLIPTELTKRQYRLSGLCDAARVTGKHPSGMDADGRFGAEC